VSSSADLLVLGAGPAGLAAAWRAARRGLQVTVHERAPQVGGMAGSFEVAGIRVDHGSHRLHPATPARLMADLETLLGDDLQLRPRHGRLRIGESWVGFPLRAGELAQRLPRRMLAGIARDTLSAPLRRRGSASYADVLRGGLGPTLYDALYSPYAVKLWGLTGERIDAAQARRRVSADTPWKVAARIAGRRRGDGQGQVFRYPRRGFGQIAEALAEGAVAAGADVRLGSAVEEVRLDDGGVTVRTAEGAQTRAPHAFSTLPLPVLARVTSPGPSLAAVEAAGRLRFRAMVLVYVVHEGGRWTEYDAHYLPGPETPVTRISEPANYRSSVDDPPDRTVLCAEIPCAVGGGSWSASADDLGAVVEEALARSVLPPVRRVAVEVRRLPHVYPIYELGYDRHLAGIDAWARALPSLTTFGRLGLFAHDNSHHAMVMGYDAVDALGAGERGRWDDAAWVAARQRFAAHVVED